MLAHARPLAALTAILAVALIPSAAADAATKSVYAGPPKAVKGAPKAADFNQFFPKSVTVALGDSIAFQFRGFHTITFPKGTAPALFIPNGKVAGLSDAGGSPFWFNGQDRIILNPTAGGPSGDGKVDGVGTENSGLPQGDAPKPFKLKFPKAGKFTYVCLVHPGMKGKVTVLKKGRKAPKSRADSFAIARQVASSLKTAKRLDKFTGPAAAGNVSIGSDTPAVVLLKYYPAAITVKAGSTVKWTMAPKTSEIHTVTFGPDALLKTLADTFVSPDPSTVTYAIPTLVVDPMTVYPSDLPVSIPVYDGANHGNGFLNSGVLDVDPRSPSPNQFSVTFSKPGTYSYICIVHGPEMSGKVTVTQ